MSDRERGIHELDTNRGANLRNANLTGAILTGADFEGADLSGAIFQGAIIERTRGLEKGQDNS